MPDGIPPEKPKPVSGEGQAVAGSLTDKPAANGAAKEPSRYYQTLSGIAYRQPGPGEEGYRPEPLPPRFLSRRGNGRNPGRHR